MRTLFTESKPIRIPRENDRLRIRHYAWIPFATLLFLTGLVSLPASKSLAQSGELLADPGFEGIKNAEKAAWGPYGLGYVVDHSIFHSGSSSIRCTNTSDKDHRGAMANILLNQKTPAPLLVTGWSKAENVSGNTDSDYSVYVDLTYMDGTPLWGQIAPFDAGTHDWQKREVFIIPSKPLKSATVYALFRNHTGTVWFDDFSVREMNPHDIFDSQPIPPPSLPKGAQSGWFVRDVAANTAPVLFTPRHDTNRKMQLKLTNLPKEKNWTKAYPVITDLSGKNRTLTVYYVERFRDTDPIWWNDIRQALPAVSGEYSNLTHLGVGATGSQSLYPFGCVSGKRTALALGVDQLIGPRVVRIAYNANLRLFYIAVDVALTTENIENRNAEGQSTATIGIARFNADPAWGFRSAAAKFYKLFPMAYDNRIKQRGIWIPFTAPDTVQNEKDFGFAFHEGDNSLKSDAQLGIMSFRYTEPMTWWMPMPVSVPRTYDDALAMVHQDAENPKSPYCHWAQAVLNSGTENSSGRFNVIFENAPWTNGAVWLLNPNPLLPSSDTEWTKARLSYTKKYADERYATTPQSGEYLDSIEGWADTLDYRRRSIEYSQVPPVYTPTDYKPVIPLWFSVWEFAKMMHDDLRARGKYLMANSTPWRLNVFLPLLDVSGTETNWMDGTTWRPDSDAIFNLRRTLSYHKCYLLLQNTDFNIFGYKQAEMYFQRSMFYDVFPSMFSANAATNPFWETPKWYNQDRPLFLKYIPVIKELANEGWDPITDARSDNPKVYLERYGRCLTLMNSTDTPQTAAIRVDLRAIGMGKSPAPSRMEDMVDHTTIAARRVGNALEFQITLAPRSAKALRME